MAIITKTEDGFVVVHDGGVDQVHVSHDPAQAAQNRKYLNQLLARYGYTLKVKGGEQSAEKQSAV